MLASGGRLATWFAAAHLWRDDLSADCGEALRGVLGVGLVVTDDHGRVRLWNEAATRLLGRSLAVGASVDEVLLDPGSGPVPLTDLDGPVLVGGRDLVVRRRPLVRQGRFGRPRRSGWVSEVRDRTEEVRLAAQVAAERDATVALRARAHEADNRLHTVVSLVELGHVQQAVDFATAVLARSQEMHESIYTVVADPVLAALLLGKAVCADEAGVALHIDPTTHVPPSGLPSQDLVLLLGNLVDNAIDAAAATPPPRWVHVLVRVLAGRIRVEVSDSGAGLAPQYVSDAFRIGWTTKRRQDPGQAHGQGLGLALVAATAHRMGGTVSVERWVGARFVVEVPVPAMDMQESV